jgi:hypothetical protein
MFAIERNQSPQELSRPLPAELAGVLKKILSFGAEHSEQPGFGEIHMLSEQAAINYVADYFDDPKYREVATTYPGIPISGDITAGGLKITVGVQPHKDGEPMNTPSPDGLPYAVAVIPFETVTAALLES